MEHWLPHINPQLSRFRLFYKFPSQSLTLPPRLLKCFFAWLCLRFVRVDKIINISCSKFVATHLRLKLITNQFLAFSHQLRNVHALTILALPKSCVRPERSEEVLLG